MNAGLYVVDGVVYQSPEQDFEMYERSIVTGSEIKPYIPALNQLKNRFNQQNIGVQRNKNKWLESLQKLNNTYQPNNKNMNRWSNRNNYAAFNGGDPRMAMYSYSTSGYNPQMNQQQYRKRSGATHGMGKNQKPFTTGWKKDGKSLLTFLCTPTKYTKETPPTSTGKVWYTAISVKITRKKSNGISVPVLNPDPKSNGVWFALMEKNTGKVIFQDYGITINPRANNGGYCGAYGGKKGR